MNATGLLHGPRYVDGMFVYPPTTRARCAYCGCVSDIPRGQGLCNTCEDDAGFDFE